jgi:4-hydroxy-tetrahydrodipicolinate synthase
MLRLLSQPMRILGGSVEDGSCFEGFEAAAGSGLRCPRQQGLNLGFTHRAEAAGGFSQTPILAPRPRRQLQWMPLRAAIDEENAMKLHGCGTALVTPFTRDGALDEKALRSLVEWQIESGIDFLVPCGTTGETPTLSEEEWLRVVRVTAEVAHGRVSIIAGATSNSTAEAVRKARTVAALPGVDGILTASPYYNKPTQEGQYQHFRAIAEAVDKPIVLYNVPGRTGANLEPATVARLAAIPNILAIKEASGSIAQIVEVIALAPESFQVLSGDDAATLGVIGAGGVGLISVASNAAPAEISAMVRAALHNDWNTARGLQRKLLPLMQALFIESNPIPVKAALAMMGRIEESYRLPMCPMKPENRAKLEKVCNAVGLLAGATLRA